MDRIPAPEFARQHATYDSAKHAAPCATCGRGLTERAAASAWHIHLATDGTLFAAADPEEDTELDQGWFPVGPECAKQIDKAYRAKL